MEHNGNNFAWASTDERACPSIPAVEDRPLDSQGDPQFASEAEEKAYWDGVTHGLRCLTGENRRADDEPPAPRDPRGEAAEVLDPSHRRPRHDGWLPWKKAEFLLVLVAGGIVADACRAVGMSVASAYALKNRRSGRAFGKMWDAILIHRARGRLADNNLSRAMNGFTEQIVKDGVVVAERRRFDNRLSMAMLTRLDRLAETSDGEEPELLRALSEDFEDYLDVVEGGGDEDAFLQAHRPQPEAEAVSDAPVTWYTKDFVDEIAALGDASEWSDYAPAEIPIVDLDPDRMGDWDFDRWIRAVRSGYLSWLEQYRDSGEARPRGRDCPAAYQRVRREVSAAMAAKRADEEAVESLNSSPAFAGECSGRPSPGGASDCRGQPAPEHDGTKRGGGVLSETGESLHQPAPTARFTLGDPAGGVEGAGPPPREISGRNEGEWQASTSSTSPAPPDSAGEGES